MFSVLIVPFWTLIYLRVYFKVQGALMVSSLFQIVIGFSGLMGLLMNFIGPLTITPTIALIGLSLFEAASDKASSQWWISLT